MEKLTKKYLKQLAKESNNKLFIAVVSDLLETPAKDLKGHILDILKYGCISGTVSSMIYHYDTLKFYNKYKEEINNLLINADIRPQDLRDFDLDDPLVFDTHNQNLLAWFGYEETCYQIAEYFGIY